MTYQNHLKENADILRQRLQGRDICLSRYRGTETFRVVRINEDNTIEVKVGHNWRHAYIDPCGLCALMVK